MGASPSVGAVVLSVAVGSAPQAVSRSIRAKAMQMSFFTVGPPYLWGRM